MKKKRKVPVFVIARLIVAVARVVNDSVVAITVVIVVVAVVIVAITRIVVAVTIALIVVVVVVAVVVVAVAVVVITVAVVIITVAVVLIVVVVTVALIVVAVAIALTIFASLVSVVVADVLLVILITGSNEVHVVGGVGVPALTLVVVRNAGVWLLVHVLLVVCMHLSSVFLRPYPWLDGKSAAFFLIWSRVVARVGLFAVVITVLKLDRSVFHWYGITVSDLNGCRGCNKT